MQVSQQMLEAVLDAALTTARGYRGRNEELYALGQLEATANLIYVTICCEKPGGMGQLEVRCQAYAQEAIERMEMLKSAVVQTHRYAKRAS